MKISHINELIKAYPAGDGLIETKEGKIYRAYKIRPQSIGSLGEDEISALEDFSSKIHEAITPFKDHHHVHFLFQRKKQESEVFSLKTRVFIFEKIKSKKEPVAPFKNSLTEMGFEVLDLKADEFKSLLTDLFCVSSGDKKLPDVSWEKEHLVVGKEKLSVVNMTELPIKTWAQCFKEIVSLPMEYIFSFHVKAPDRQKVKKKLNTKRRISHVMSFHNSAELKNIESESTLSSSEEQLERLTTGGESLFEISAGFICKGSSRAELKEKIDQILRSATCIAETGFYDETLGVLESFKSHLPAMAPLNVRIHSILSRNLAHMLPLCMDHYCEDERKGPEVVSPNFEESTLNIFSKKNLNFNGFICGASGSGKSFLMSSMIDAFLRDHKMGRVLIFDVGGSYKRLIPELGGRAVELDAEIAKNLILDFLSTQSFQNNGFCKTVLENFCGAGPHITHSHRAAIESALIDLNEKHFLISKIHQYFEQKKDNVSQDIALWLRPYRQWEKIEVRSKLEDYLKEKRLAFDFKNLDGEPLLQRLAILCLTQKLWQDLNSSGSTEKTLVIFDEVWKFFAQSRSFLEELYRTLRKYGAGIVSITQNISDYGDKNFAKTVLSNSYTKVFLQGAGSSKLLGELMDLSEDEKNKILNVSSKKGKYSEFLVLTPRFRQRMRLYPTNRLYALANTESIQSQSLDGELK